MRHGSTHGACFGAMREVTELNDILLVGGRLGRILPRRGVRWWSWAVGRISFVSAAMPIVEPGWRRGRVHSVPAPTGSSREPVAPSHECEEPEEQQWEQQEAEGEEERSATVGLDDDGITPGDCRSIGIGDPRHGRMPVRSPISIAPVRCRAYGAHDQHDENDDSDPGSSHGETFPMMACPEGKIQSFNPCRRSERSRIGPELGSGNVSVRIWPQIPGSDHHVGACMTDLAGNHRHQRKNRDPFEQCLHEYSFFLVDPDVSREAAWTRCGRWCPEATGWAAIRLLPASSVSILDRRCEDAVNVTRKSDVEAGSLGDWTLVPRQQQRIRLGKGRS